MADKSLQFYRGPQSGIPTLKEAEPGWTTDEKRLYVGDGTNNVAIANKSDVATVQSDLDTLEGKSVTVETGGSVQPPETLTGPFKIIMTDEDDDEPEVGGGLTQEQADQRYLQKTGGYASGSIGVASGDSSLELQVNTSGDTLTLAFINRVAGGAYIRNTEDAEINIGTERGFRMNSRYKDLVLTGGNFVSATAPSDDDHLTNKAYVDSKVPLAFGPQTVASSAWASDSTYSDYPYRAAVALSGVTANHVPSVNFNSTDALSGKLSPISESYDGGVYIYATEALTSEVNVGSITCIKAVSI